VPLLIGTVKNEFMPSSSAGLSNASSDQVMAYIKKQQGDKADAYIAAIKKAYPSDTKPSDLVDVDVVFRPGAVEFAKEKSALNAAPVYMYLFTWQSPVMDGKYKAVHCMELPFVFNNIARCEEMTGGTKEAYELAAKMSDAWINFARTGNPNTKSLPQWTAFNASNTATMYFDNKCEVKPQMDKELFDLLDL
jgi:para-nitrobenzyl esterase